MPDGTIKGRRIAMFEGLDLDARVEQGVGFYGYIADTDLPEVGPFNDVPSTEEALKKVVGIYIKYERNPERTINSPEYKALINSIPKKEG